MKLTLAGQEVEHVNYPGHATSLLGLASYSSEYQKGCGLAQGWYADTNNNAAPINNGFDVRQQFLIRSPDPKGSFQWAIPMKHIFGFMDDYTKVLVLGKLYCLNLRGLYRLFNQMMYVE